MGRTHLYSRGFGTVLGEQHNQKRAQHGGGQGTAHV